MFLPHQSLLGNFCHDLKFSLLLPNLMLFALYFFYLFQFPLSWIKAYSLTIFNSSICSDFSSSSALISYFLLYYSLQLQYVTSISRYFLSSYIDFLSMTSFLCHIWLLKMNSGKVYSRAIVKATLTSLFSWSFFIFSWHPFASDFPNAYKLEKKSNKSNYYL